MLPEIFKGNTMQEDFGFFNASSCLNEKASPLAPSNNSVLIDFESSNNLLQKESGTALSQSSPDINNKWPFNYGVNFLKTSDDPMISSINQESVRNENELFKRSSSNSESCTSPKTNYDEITLIEDSNLHEDQNKNFIKSQIHQQLLSLEQMSSMESSHSNRDKIKGHKVKSHDNSHQMDEEGIIWLQNMILKANNNELKKGISPQRESIPSSSKSVNAQNVEEDLPYMGQMTLENMKPRRGRKPKKADICHLIFKNYGTVIPKSSPTTATSTNVSKPVKGLKPSETKKSTASLDKSDRSRCLKSSQVEPLNLCTREKVKPGSSSKINWHLRNITSTSTVKTKQKPPLDNSNCTQRIDFDSASSSNSTNVSSNEMMTSEGQLNKDFFKVRGGEEQPKITDENSSNFGLIIHPMILCLMGEKLKESSTDSEETTTKLMNSVVLDSSQKTDCSASNDEKSSSPISTNSMQLQKRKRSAIFIPPVQTEFSSNPTNEVSICKFKFTGGTKPSLQEKKILSVDSGGNFRYFSGTGDKSMRGYEFFPRENLLKSSMSSASHTNAFLNAASQKLLLPSISPNINNKLLNLDEVDTTQIDQNLLENNEDDCVHFKLDKLDDNSDTPNTAFLNHRKTINRSIQRRKLEKTFKEKGFLIQTQQLQSAEGATYCKFRQLRKFTRYLFRSWKDYLPPCEPK